MIASALTTMSVQATKPSLAGMQPITLPQTGTVVSAESAGSADAAHWCGASVHMLPETGAAFAGTSAASPTQHSSRAMPVAEIAEIGDGTTTLVPSGQARLSLSERQVRTVTCSSDMPYALPDIYSKRHAGAQTSPWCIAHSYSCQFLHTWRFGRCTNMWSSQCCYACTCCPASWQQKGLQNKIAIKAI